MKYRKLRIAVTVLGLTACLLLIALWVRSYWRNEKILWVYRSPHAIRIFWGDGRIQFETATNQPIQISTTALGTFDWHESRFFSAVPDSTSLPFEFAICGLNFDKAVPIQLPVVFAATLAALPWLRWRFSLRTLLIGMTLVAAALGLVFFASRN